MHRTLKKIFKCHFEWMAFAAGLLFMAMMNPYVDQGASWCFFEWIGIGFCPGEGLGHSIAFIFRGDLQHAWQANMLGPFAVIMLVSRIVILIRQNVYSQPLLNEKTYSYGTND